MRNRFSNINEQNVSDEELSEIISYNEKCIHYAMEKIEFSKNSILLIEDTISSFKSDLHTLFCRGANTFATKENLFLVNLLIRIGLYFRKSSKEEVIINDVFKDKYVLECIKIIKCHLGVTHQDEGFSPEDFEFDTSNRAFYMQHSYSVDVLLLRMFRIMCERNSCNPHVPKMANIVTSNRVIGALIDFESNVEEVKRKYIPYSHLCNILFYLLKEDEKLGVKRENQTHCTAAGLRSLYINKYSRENLDPIVSFDREVLGVASILSQVKNYDGIFIHNDI